MAKAANKSARSSKAKTKGKASAPKKFTIVVEGDSWERLPDLGLKGLPIVGGANYDLTRALRDRGHMVHNLAYWGDTIREIARVKAYLPALRTSGAPYLLLGGGGNDLLAEGRLRQYLNLYQADLEPSDYVKNNFYVDLREVLLNYERVLVDIADDPAVSSTKIIVHGYDYARPMRLGWLGDPMELMGIDHWKPQLQNAIVQVLINAFNRELKLLATRWSNVTYVNFRNKVGDRWHDELHPRKEAFADLAAFLESKLA